MTGPTPQSCSYCDCSVDDDEIFTTGDPVDPYICIDCIEKAEERRSLDLADRLPFLRRVDVFED